MDFADSIIGIGEFDGFDKIGQVILGIVGIWSGWRIRGVGGVCCGGSVTHAEDQVGARDEIQNTNNVVRGRRRNSSPFYPRMTVYVVYFLGGFVVCMS